MSGLVTALLLTSAMVLALSALMVTARITRGPTMLDRAMSFDVLVTITIMGIALDAALRRDAENLPLLLVATLLGFVGSVSVARFSPGSDDLDSDDGGEDDGAPARAADPELDEGSDAAPAPDADPDVDADPAPSADREGPR